MALLPLCPPKSTTMPRLGSPTMTAPARGVGLWAGCCCTQSVPDHSQVSLSMALKLGPCGHPPSIMM